MAPTDRINLPLRWEFAPLKRPGDGAIRWTWRAYTQAGKLAMQSEGEFDGLSECMANAREHGYAPQ